MDQKTIFRLGLLLWTLSFIAAFVNFGVPGGNGIGFVSGVTSTSKFLIWQCVAGAIAIALWVYGRRFERGSMQRAASRLPGIILIALVVAMVLFLGTAQLITPGGSDIAGPTTDMPAE